MHATPTLHPVSLRQFSVSMPSKNRVAICLPRPIDVDALAVMIELATTSQVVARSTDPTSAMEHDAAAIDLLVIDESMLGDGNAKRIASVADSDGLRVGVLVRELGNAKRLAGLPAFAEARGLIRWIEGDRKSKSAAKNGTWAPQTCKITRREREVWRLIAEGYSVRGVAEQMQLAVSTVDSHKSRLMKKLRVHKSLDLVRLAVRLGMVDP